MTRQKWTLIFLEFYMKYQIIYNGLRHHGYNYSFEDFTHSIDTPYNLAMAFLTNYERPLDPNQPSRGIQAQEWFEFLGGIIPPTNNKNKWLKYKSIKKRIIF